MEAENMFCRNCGKEVQDDWKICPVCGESLKENQEEKIDDGGDEYKKDQEENLGKEFEIFDDIFYVSDGRKLVCDVRAFVTKLAIEARDEFIDTYHKLENIDNVVEKGLDVVSDIYVDKANKCAQFLVNKGIYTISSRTLIKNMKSNYFEKGMDELQEWYISTLKEQEEQEEYRRLRKEYRNKWSGMGFGVGGALKAQTKAAAMNTVSGMAHGVRNTIGNAITSFETSMSKKDKYNDENLMYSLGMKVYMDVFEWNFVMQVILYDAGYSVEAIGTNEEIKAEGIFSNIKNIGANKEKKDIIFEMAYDLLETNPTEKEYYEYLIDLYPSEQLELIRLAKYSGLDMRDVGEKCLLKYLNDADCSTEEKAIDIYNNIKKGEEQFEIENSEAEKKIKEILTKYDEEARTYKDILFDTREQRKTAEEDDIKLVKLYPDKRIDTADEKECNLMKSEIENAKDQYTTKIAEIYINKIKKRIEYIWSNEDKGGLVDIFMHTDVQSDQGIQQGIDKINLLGRTKDKEKYINLLEKFKNKDNIKKIQKGVDAPKNKNKYKTIAILLFVGAGFIYIIGILIIAILIAAIGVYMLSYDKKLIEKADKVWNELTLDGTIVHPYLASIRSGENN